MKKATVFGMCVAFTALVTFISPLAAKDVQKDVPAPAYNFSVVIHPASSTLALGIEQIVYLDASDPAIARMLQDGLEVNTPVRLIVVKRESFLGELIASDLEACALTLNPFGILFIEGIDATVLKHELYHWWEQEQQGRLSWFFSYFKELTSRILLYQGDTDLAINMLSYERRAWAYAGQSAGPKRPFHYCGMDFTLIPSTFQLYYGLYQEYLLKLYF